MLPHACVLASRGEKHSISTPLQFSLRASNERLHRVMGDDQALISAADAAMGEWAELVTLKAESTLADATQVAIGVIQKTHSCLL
jgi:hypothetical protein